MKRHARGLGLLCLAVSVSGCRSGQAELSGRVQTPPARPSAAKVLENMGPTAPRAATEKTKACTPHIPKTPSADYPTWTSSCSMPTPPPDYPSARPASERPWEQAEQAQQAGAATGPLRVDDPKNIEKLLNALKAYVAPVFGPYLADPTNAAIRPDSHGWRMMPWLGDADCNAVWDGRESSAGTSTGQLIPAGTLPGQNRTKVVGDLQNHSITWYDPWGAFAISKVFGSGPDAPHAGDPSAQQMGDGAVIVKIGVLTPYADGTYWPVVERAPTWPVYRPPVGKSTDYFRGAPHDCTVSNAEYELLQTRVLQFDIVLKSSYYAPETHWVFATWIYDPDSRAPSDAPLDHFTILGATWGNDPGIAQADFCTPVSPLQETWLNPKAPAYGYEQLGWGCRLSGPIDVARRPAEFADGSCETARVSSCMSCHGVSEIAKTGAGLEPATMYPLATPLHQHDKSFLLVEPGSAQWWRWFQSRAPTAPQGDQTGAHPGSYLAYDYDMVFMLAVPISGGAHGNETQQKRARAIGASLNRARRRHLAFTEVQPNEGPVSTRLPGCDCRCEPKITRARGASAAPSTARLR